MINKASVKISSLEEAINIKAKELDKAKNIAAIILSLWKTHGANKKHLTNMVLGGLYGSLLPGLLDAHIVHRKVKQNFH